MGHPRFVVGGMYPGLFFRVRGKGECTRGCCSVFVVTGNVPGVVVPVWVKGMSPELVV